MRRMFRVLSALAVAWLAVVAVPANALGQEEASGQILITNINVFDGRTDGLAMGQDVLVEGNLIKEIGGDVQARGDAIVIEGNGRTLMPGLIDGHAHVMINHNFPVVETNMDITDIAYRATLVAKRFLVDGFTSVRDMGGPAFGLQRNIDTGVIVGPRIFPSGAFISQTSGHGDFRERGDPGLLAQRARRSVELRAYGHRHGSRRSAGGPEGDAPEPPQRRDPDQDHGRRRRLVPVRSDRHDAVLRGGDLRHSRGGGRLGHVRRGPHLQRSRGRAPPGMWCEVLRPWLLHLRERPCRASRRGRLCGAAECGGSRRIWREPADAARTRSPWSRRSASSSRTSDATW